MASAVSSKYRNLDDLPYDLVRVLCTLLSGRDISALLSTCHNLHALYPDESIWQELCDRFGIKDARILGDPSFQTVYTQILYTYGPLLGLWASDHPYKGSIVEFRVDKELKGIVGEVWRFWPRTLRHVEDIEATRRPNPPEYYRFMHIALDRDEGRLTRVALNWYIPDAGQQWYYGPGTASIRVPTLHVGPPTNLGISVRFSIHRALQTVTLPAFPPSETVCWYDNTRGLPRLHTEAAAKLSLPWPDVVQPHYMATVTDTTCPAAIMFRPPHHFGRFTRDIFAIHEPHLPLEDIRNLSYPHWEVGWFYRRFYPLRSRIRDGQDPGRDDWDPASLEGLWLGSYGPHGTEVLFLEYDGHHRVTAWKITGDLNVPRGAESWTINMESPVQLNDLAAPTLHQMGKIKRLYRGTGTISSAGFFHFCFLHMNTGRGESFTVACAALRCLVKIAC